MSVLHTRPALRWLVPAAATVAVIGGGLAVGALAAAADPSLPQRSAAELLVDLQTARLDGLSGTIVERADLGLPALPNLGGQGSADLTSLISGTHTLRVWYSGPDKARVALVGALGESDVITNGTDVWTWSSTENKATHTTLPAGGAGIGGAGIGGATKATPGGPAGMSMTPQQLATLALSMLNPTTAISTDGSAKVAGRDAYELILAPKDPGSLIGSVRLAIDATEHVPLRVQVYAHGSDAAAIEVAFTQVSFARPDDAQFTFNPPPGATVTEATQNPKDATDPKSTDPKGGASSKNMAIIGTGWTSVLVARMPQSDATTADPTKANPTSGQGTSDPARSFDLTGLLKNLPAVSGNWGSGHLLTSRLVSVLVTDDGRILAGAVGADRLYQAAADPKATLGS